ncbi:hypothetical protein K1Y80_02285 [Streptomyces sp. MAG02]|nr:hypothetical protein [Streptomyces sp. MAG02]
MRDQPEESTTYRVWNCQRCRYACKVEPPAFKPGCRCDRPVPGLRPTLVTQMHAPKVRPMRALGDEEARLRELVLSRKPVRVTYEGRVVKAWSAEIGGEQRITLIVEDSTGRRHAVEPWLPTVDIDAAEPEHRPA